MMSKFSTQPALCQLPVSLRIALGVEYQGTRYHGWQLQRGCPLSSVEGCLQKACEQIVRHEVKLHAAGRTDAGVHALGQVVHFDTPMQMDNYRWVKAINHQLPKDIAITWAAPVASGFHARYSAVAREYSYWIYTSGGRKGLWSDRMLYWSQKFLANRVQKALQCLQGEKDFSSFRSSDCQSKSPYRHMLAASLSELHPGQFKLTFKANAFLHHMVRNLVGSLLWVASDKRSPDWMEELLETKSRKAAGPTAPPQGL